ncbi:uncharacterized protein [Dermacentor andersoni]|uniref:uncharacterized protein n=1 Tax=Dermacentor andersoni TaxID=34620 RepID=UPI00241743E1|nr:uncharacterized protein LOC129385696 [Dermacentor andersoni]
MSHALQIVLLFGALWITETCHHHHKYKCGVILKDGDKCKTFVIFKKYYGVCCGDLCVVPPASNPCLTPRPPSSTTTSATNCYDACEKPCLAAECGVAPSADCRKRCVDLCSMKCGGAYPPPPVSG